MCIGIIWNNSFFSRRTRSSNRSSATANITLYCTWRPSGLTIGLNGQGHWVECCVCSVERHHAGRGREITAVQRAPEAHSAAVLQPRRHRPRPTEPVWTILTGGRLQSSLHVHIAGKLTLFPQLWFSEQYNNIHDGDGDDDVGYYYYYVPVLKSCIVRTAATGGQQAASANLSSLTLFTFLKFLPKLVSLYMGIMSWSSLITSLIAVSLKFWSLWAASANFDRWVYHVAPCSPGVVFVRKLSLLPVNNNSFCGSVLCSVSIC